MQQKRAGVRIGLVPSAAAVLLLLLVAGNPLYPIALQPAAASHDVLLTGAGVDAVNGFWHIMPKLANGAPQFQHVHNDTLQYEMFVHTTPEGSWWNIQELVVTDQAKKIQRYGEVPYVSHVQFDMHGNVFLPKNWIARAEAHKPSPRLSDTRACTSTFDCDHNGHDECVDFFIDGYTQDEFLHELLHNQGAREVQQCRDNGDWIRDLTKKEIAQYRDDFFVKGYVAISNFLRPDIYNELTTMLEQRVHSLFWQASFVDSETGRAVLVPRHPNNTMRINRERKYQHRLRDQGKYAYSFTRTSSNNPPKYRRFYRLFFGDMRAMLDSNKLQAYLTEITVRKYELSVLFTSKYTSGDFLDRHSDSVETRKIAFTLHLTKGWRLEYGGLLLFLDENNWDTAKKVFVPQANTLTFFDVSEERRVSPHMVTEVSSGISHERIAITGWMQYRGEEDKFAFYPQEEGWDYD